MISQDFSNANIRYFGCKMDVNGNKCLVLSIAGGRKFSLQVLAFGVGSGIDGGVGRQSPSELSDKVQRQVVSYLRAFGSKLQRKTLVVYS